MLTQVLNEYINPCIREITDAGVRVKQMKR